MTTQTKGGSEPTPKEHVIFSIDNVDHTLTVRIDASRGTNELVQEVTVAVIEAYTKMASHGINGARVLLV